MKPANFAPLYAVLGLYPQLAEIARKYGYAMAVHGSMGRDFDLVCIPWTKDAGEPDDIVKEILDTFCFKQMLDPDVVEHGRKRYDLRLSYGDCYIDLSFMPKIDK